MHTFIQAIMALKENYNFDIVISLRFHYKRAVQYLHQEHRTLW